MNRLYYILPLLLLPLVLAQPPTTWKLPFSIYRLIYNFTLTQNATDLYVHVVLPTNIIDQYLTYWQSKGINVSQFPELLIPRVYYYNETTGQEVMVQNQITCLSTYRGYCHNFTIYFPSLPAGTHYITIYMPAFFWEDFEDNPLNARISNVGECFNDGWCYYSHENDRHYAKIVSNGWEPTPNKRLEIYAFEDYWGDDEWFIIYREVNMTVNPNYPLIAEWDADATHSRTAPDASIIFQFRLKDGSIKSIKYRIYGSADYRRSELNICNVVDVGKGHTRRDLLRDLTQYCGVCASQVDKLERIYLQVYTSVGDYDHWTKMWIDNFKLIIPTP